MKKLIKKILLTFLGFCIKNKNILRFVVKNLKYDHEIVDIIIRKNRELFVNICDQFPSSINNGYRHIERVLHFAELFQLPETNIIIDVGAADGVISKRFSDAYPNSLIYAYEPIKTTFNILKENVIGNSFIIPINKALGDSHGEKNIHITERVTSSSILNIEKEISDQYLSKQLKFVKDEKILITRLDDEISKDTDVNIIKIDVQGYELEVLKGAVNTLKNTRLIVLEMQNHNNYNNAPEYFVLDNYLRNLGFDLIDLVPSIRVDNILYEWDGIYRNRTHVRV